MISCKYLVRVISAANDYWSAVLRNMVKAWAVRQRLTRILSREGVAPQVYGFLFKAMVQLVLLFGAETWIVTPYMGRVLGGVPIPGGKTIDGEAPMAADIREIGIHLGSGGKGGGGI